MKLKGFAFEEGLVIAVGAIAIITFALVIYMSLSCEDDYCEEDYVEVPCISYEKYHRLKIAVFYSANHIDTMVFERKNLVTRFNRGTFEVTNDIFYQKTIFITNAPVKVLSDETFKKAVPSTKWVKKEKKVNNK